MLRFIVILLMFSAPAYATLAENLPKSPNWPGGPIQKFYEPIITVDGLPTYRSEWRVWDATRGLWVPMMSPRGMKILYGISEEPVDPETMVPAPPIPKRQRRME
jgi:hypothetical protein